MGKVCTLINPKGGSGKSTTLFNLAIRFAREGLRVAVVDMDVQESIREFIQDRTSMGLEAPFDYNPIHSGSASTMGPLVEHVAQNADITLIDTPARYTEESFVALALADLAIVPMRPTRADYTALGQLVRRLPIAENPNLRFEVVLNQVRNHRYLRASEVYAQLLDKEVPHLHFSEIMLGQRVYWERTSLGLSVLEQEPVSADAINELENLFSFTRNCLGL